MPDLGLALTGQYLVNITIAIVVLYGLARAMMRAWFREKARHLRELMKDVDPTDTQ